MRSPHLFLLLVFSTLLVGCGEPLPDISSPKTHRSGTITFDYPGNWKVVEDLVTPAVHSLFVETPGDTLVILQSYPVEDAVDLTSFSEAFSKNAMTDSSVVKMDSSVFASLPDASGYKWVREDFNVNLFSESVPHRRLYGIKVMGDRQMVFILQVPTEDYATADAGFQLIRDTLSSK